MADILHVKVQESVVITNVADINEWALGLISKSWKIHLLRDELLHVCIRHNTKDN